jgi:hypothetical protein
MAGLADSLALDGSIASLDAAAAWRTRDAELLQDQGRLGAAAYLFGYVVEMRLTAACFRVLDFDLERRIDRIDRQTVERDARRLHLMSREPHDLAGWGRYLVYLRQRESRGYPRPFATDLISAVEGAYDNWRPRLRYRSLTPSAGQLAYVHDAAIWLSEHYTKLWS